ncbi:MAG: hypothetical protein ACI4LS_11195 [Treponema sp.]
MEIMKVYPILILIILSLFFFSCASTKSPATELITETELINDTELINETENKGFINENAIKTENTPEIEEVIEIKKEPTESEIFIQKIEKINIKCVLSPSVVTKNRNFSSAYEFLVSDGEMNPVSEFKITLTYPSAKSDDEVLFSSVELLSDESGKVSFEPPKPSFSCISTVTAYPTPINQEEEVLKAVDQKKVEADWKVRSDVINKGAVLFIWDFNEKNRPVNNSYEILSEFRKRGITMVGNAPVNDSEYIGKSLDFLYKENYEIIEASYGYLICGTVKFLKPVEPCDEGYLCSLTSNIEAVDMKNGKKVFSKTFAHEATGKNWNSCVSKCKSELAKMIVDEIFFGM